MTKHAEDLTIAPFDYFTIDGRDARTSAMTHGERRRRLGLPRPAHAGGWFKNNRAALEDELGNPIPVDLAFFGAGNNEVGSMLDTVARLMPEFERRTLLEPVDPLDSEAWVAANPLPKTITFRDGRES